MNYEGRVTIYEDPSVSLRCTTRSTPDESGLKLLLEKREGVLRGPFRLAALHYAIHPEESGLKLLLEKREGVLRGPFRLAALHYAIHPRRIGIETSP